MTPFAQMDHSSAYNFHDLMSFRVREILLVSSYYDAFVLEEDGRLSERIFSEFVDLHLRFIPRITRVATAEEGLQALAKRHFDVVITMTRLADMDPFQFGKKIKERYPRKPVILLTFEVLSPDMIERIRNQPSIDKIFYWSGDTKIMLAITKYVEDLKNVERDVRQGVQVVLIVEDTSSYYSSFLPLIYTEIMTQTRALISEGVNDVHRLLRMRARPKILMAETFEQAIHIYETYKHNLLGIISDVRFPKEGRLDAQAGFHLVEHIRQEFFDLPILLQSLDSKNQARAQEKGVAFLNKNSPNLLLELRTFICENFGFGDFIFRLPNGEIIGRAKNIQEFERLLETVPAESMIFHAQRNHFSRWFRARSEFRIANALRAKQVSDFKDIDELRADLRNTIARLTNQQEAGVIWDFNSTRLDGESAFIRLGDGSLGGKGRGIAFMYSLLSKSDLHQKFPGIAIKTPHTFVICSGVFEEFVATNNLQKFAMTATCDEELAQRFLQAPLPPTIYQELDLLVQKVHYPLAVRSSSLLEDSQMLPFAGVYQTYMLPNNHPRKEVRLKQLCDAIKLVYVSIFYRSPKEYVRNTNYRIEEEKMAVIIQQLVGNAYGDIYYPVVSGVAQTYNFYPFGHLKHEDGIVQLALGLGKTIVDGERIYRFCPAFPEMNPPYASPVELMKNTQATFYALDLSPDIQLGIDDACHLKREDLKRAERDGTLFFVGSTFVAADYVIRDTLDIPGPRVVTFANLLKYNLFPLAELTAQFMQMGRVALGTHVEIEFAVNLFREPERRPEFYFLQIRPMVTGLENVQVQIERIARPTALCMGTHVMGNGVYDDLQDLLYLDPQTFDIAKSRQIALEMDQLNQSLGDQGRHYILIGFGRWGTTDPWLGIPVKWSQMSRAKIIVEANKDTLKVEPSQGSHFFHNMVSLKLGYFHFAHYDEQNFIDWEWLVQQPIYQRTQFVCHVRFERPLKTKLDGRSSCGVIFKPDHQTN